MFLAETDLANVAFVFSFVRKAIFGIFVIDDVLYLFDVITYCWPYSSTSQTWGMGFWKPM